MEYGKDYGVKVDVPWYVKCPIVNWFVNTIKVHVTFTTFTGGGAPLLGVSGTFRIPYKDKGDYINSLMRVKYCFPDEHGLDYGLGIYATITLIDMNHRKVYESAPTTQAPSQLDTGYHVKPQKGCPIWFGTWRDELVDVTFNKKDYGRKVQK